MFKNYFSLASLLTIMGVSLIAHVGCREQLPAGQAGVAYIETDDGGLERLDEVRPAERTTVPEHEPATQTPATKAANKGPVDGGGVEV